MALLDDLVRLETDGWQAISERRGGEFYGEVLAGEGVMVLPGAMVLDKRTAIPALDGPVTWEWFRIEDEHTVAIGDDAAALVYRATAQRPGEPEYRAMMTSVYARRDGSWRMVLHQQTPF
jgi:hypothetical protein